MRQIRIGAWLLLACSAVVACNGEEFARSGSSDTSNVNDGSGEQANQGSSTSKAGRNSAGTSSAGTSQSTAGKSTTGGSGGTSTPSPGGTSAGGSGGTGNPGGDECAEGRVTFKMVPGPDLPVSYLCDAGCGTGWLTITDAEGASAFPIFAACGTASCESCELLPCAAAACLPTPLTHEGNALSWTGTYLAQGKCGADMACQKSTCVPPGKYKAKACASISAGAGSTPGSCAPKNDAMLCTEVVFDFPSDSEIELVFKK